MHVQVCERAAAGGVQPRLGFRDEVGEVDEGPGDDEGDVRVLARLVVFDVAVRGRVAGGSALSCSSMSMSR